MAHRSIRSVTIAVLVLAILIACETATRGPTSQQTSDASSEIGIAEAHLDLAVVKLAPIANNGAIGFNRNQWHSVAEQRRISPWILEGLVRRDGSMISSAVMAIEYSFAHQNSDGSFQVVQMAGSSDLKTFDPVGVAFFYSDLGRGLALLNESSWFQHSSTTQSLRQRISGLRSHIDLGLNWLMAPSALDALHKTGQSGTNRWTFGSNALVLTGQWLGNQSSVEEGIGILRLILSSETSGGVFPERGGFDSSYQGVTLQNLFFLYMHLPRAGASIKSNLEKAIAQGVARERQAIQPDGQIVTDGNTRVYCGGEEFLGKQKGGEFQGVVTAFLYESRREPSYLMIAKAVASYYSSRKGGPAKCPA